MAEFSDTWTGILQFRRLFLLYLVLTSIGCVTAGSGAVSLTYELKVDLAAFGAQTDADKIQPLSLSVSDSSRAVAEAFCSKFKISVEPCRNLKDVIESKRAELRRASGDLVGTFPIRIDGVKDYVFPLYSSDLHEGRLDARIDMFCTSYAVSGNACDKLLRTARTRLWDAATETALSAFADATPQGESTQNSLWLLKMVASSARRAVEILTESLEIRAEAHRVLHLNRLQEVGQLRRKLARLQRSLRGLNGTLLSHRSADTDNINVDNSKKVEKKSIVSDALRTAIHSPCMPSAAKVLAVHSSGRGRRIPIPRISFREINRDCYLRLASASIPFILTGMDLGFSDRHGKSDSGINRDELAQRLKKKNAAPGLSEKRSVHAAASKPTPAWALIASRICGEKIVKLHHVEPAGDHSTDTFSSVPSTIGISKGSMPMWAGLSKQTEKMKLVDFLALHFDVRDVQHSSDTGALFDRPDSAHNDPRGKVTLMLHDFSLGIHCPKLANFTLVPKLFADDIMQRIPVHSTLPSWRYFRDYWPSLFLGSQGSGSAIHADWAGTSAWMGMLAGSKRWRIVPPVERPLLDEGPLNIFALSLSEEIKPAEVAGDATSHPDLRPNDAEVLSMLSIYECVLREGEVLFVPPESAHQVENLETPTAAIASNFVDIAGLESFKRRLRDRAMIGGAGEYGLFSRVLEVIRKFEKAGNLDEERRALLRATSGPFDQEDACVGREAQRSCNDGSKLCIDVSEKSDCDGTTASSATKVNG
jgi:hypothetical protein